MGKPLLGAARADAVVCPFLLITPYPNRNVGEFMVSPCTFQLIYHLIQVIKPVYKQKDGGS